MSAQETWGIVLQPFKGGYRAVIQKGAAPVLTLTNERKRAVLNTAFCTWPRGHFQWLAGKAASQSLAGAYRLEYRKRRPGAGRPASVTPRPVVRPVTIRLSGGGYALLETLCKARNEPQAAVVEAGLEALNPAKTG